MSDKIILRVVSTAGKSSTHTDPFRFTKDYAPTTTKQTIHNNQSENESDNIFNALQLLIRWFILT